MRHHSAAAACSSGSGPAGGRAARSSWWAVTPARDIAASRSASSGVNSSPRTCGATSRSSWRHSFSAGVWSPVTAPVEPSLPASRSAFCSCGAPVGRRSSAGDLHGGSPHLDVGRPWSASGRSPFCAHAGQRPGLGCRWRRWWTWSASSARPGAARWVEVAAPVRVLGQTGRDCRASTAAARRPVLRSPEASRRQSSTAARSPAVSSSRSLGGRPQRGHGVLARWRRAAAGGRAGSARRPRRTGRAAAASTARVHRARRRTVRCRRRPRRRRRGCRGSAGRPRRAGSRGRPARGSGWSRTAGRRRGPASTRGCRWG